MTFHNYVQVLFDYLLYVRPQTTILITINLKARKLILSWVPALGPFSPLSRTYHAGRLPTRLARTFSQRQPKKLAQFTVGRKFYTNFQLCSWADKKLGSTSISSAVDMKINQVHSEGEDRYKDFLPAAVLASLVHLNPKVDFKFWGLIAIKLTVCGSITITVYIFHRL